MHYEIIFGEDGDLFLLIESLDVPKCARMFATICFFDGGIELRVGGQTLRLENVDAGALESIRDLGRVGVCEVDAQSGAPAHIYYAVAAR